MASTSGSEETAVPASRPSLEYAYAFDIAAAGLLSIGSEVLAVCSNPFYRREMQHRLCSRGGQDGPVFMTASEQRIQEVRRFKGGLWAEPEDEDAQVLLHMLKGCLIPNAPLYVITSGFLARFLPEWKPGPQEGSLPSRQLLGPGRTAELIKNSGLSPESVYGFHGPLSILWGKASRLMATLGRDDLSDRCLSLMRWNYVSRSPWWASCPVALIIARKV